MTERLWVTRLSLNALDFLNRTPNSAIWIDFQGVKLGFIMLSVVVVRTQSVMFAGGLLY